MSKKNSGYLYMTKQTIPFRGHDDIRVDHTVDITTNNGRHKAILPSVRHHRPSRPLQPQLKTNQFSDNWSYIPNAMSGDGIPNQAVYYDSSQKQPAQYFVTMLLNKISDRPPTEPTGSKGSEFQFEMYSDAKKEVGAKIKSQCY